MTTFVVVVCLFFPSFFNNLFHLYNYRLFAYFKFQYKFYKQAPNPSPTLLHHLQQQTKKQKKAESSNTVTAGYSWSRGDKSFALIS